MPEPVSPQKRPYVLELAPGEYWWCACGQSKNQPFCDGSHKKDGAFTPVKFTVVQAGKEFMCGCKRTKTPPFCDGTHKSL
jgi:CDGSH-type Zn-finger protein